MDLMEFQAKELFAKHDVPVSLGTVVERAEDARAAARQSGRPHNVARQIFVTEAIHALSRQIAERIGADPLGGDNLLSDADLAETRRELREDIDVQRALFEFWPVLTARQVLRDQIAGERRLGRAGDHAVAQREAEHVLDHRVGVDEQWRDQHQDRQAERAEQ